MSFEVKTTPDFERSLKRIAKKQQSIHKDLLMLILQLKDEPRLGIEIRTNLFKIRLNISSSNKGKSGGARVITYVVQTKETVFLAEIYLKSEFDTIDEDLLIKRLTAQGYV
jgi:mRNA-degrading endonuclease RelE of RelBE toxin-antitoxin system